MSTPTWGLDPKARRISVYFEGSTTIYEGMPVCYNYDTTDNWLGVASIDFTSTASSITESGTTAEGAQNKGKFIRVERPVAGNLTHFAGVVAGADHAGETGPKALDIYIPNGAIVPVRCDVDTTTGITVLCIAEGEEELGCSSGAASSRPVAIAMETETGLDETADITLAKLDPNLFLYNSADGTALDLGLGYGHTDLYVTSAITTQFLPFQVRSQLTGTGAGGLIGAKYTTDMAGTACVGDVYGLWSQAACLTGGAISAAGKLVGMWAKTHTATDAGTQAGAIYGLQVSIYHGVACTGRTAFIYFDEGTAVAESVDYLFEAYDGSPSGSCAYTADTSGTNQSGAIKIRIKGGDHYLHTFDNVAGAT